MDFSEILLYVAGIIFVGQFLRYVMTAQNILGIVMQSPDVRIVDRSECPEYLRDFYAVKEKELIRLGFEYRFCMLMDNFFARDYSWKRYVFVFYHQQEKTYATLSPSDTLDNYLPFWVVFRTYYKNGRRSMTYNGMKHAMIGDLPGATVKDGYVETVEKQFDYHLKNIAGLNEGEISEYNGELTPEEFIKEEARLNEKYLEKLAEDGLVYPVAQGKYAVKTIASLRIAHQLMSGIKKIAQLHEKIKKLGNRIELPVELEVENFLTQKSALNQKIKNKSGKLIFLLVSIAFFAAALLFFMPPSFVVMLVLVIFLHESGHLLAMKLLGFKNLRMLFIPLFGAVAMGSDKGVAPYKKVIAFFAGPVPGILLAFLLLYLHFRLNFSIISRPDTIAIVLVLLFINYLNLIPVLPFDGGQIFNTVIFSRLAALQFTFNLLSFLALTALTVLLKTPLLIVIALFNVIGMRQYFVHRRFMEGFDSGGWNPTDLPEKELLKKIFLRFRELPIKAYNNPKKFRIAMQTETALTTRKASNLTAAITIIFYILLFAVPAYVFISAYNSLPFKPSLTYKDPCKEVRETAKPANILVDKSDFKRVDGSETTDGTIVKHRYCFLSNDPSISPLPGDFLARLQALFGEPDSIDNGFSYTLMEQESGIRFTANFKAGQSASYRYIEKDRKQAIALVYRFEALLQKTTPVECSFAYSDQFARREIGFYNGEPYFDTFFENEKEIGSVELLDLIEPVSIQLDEFDRMLYVYTIFFAIAHDEWLSSEASMLKTKVEVSGFPTQLLVDEQIELFPHIKKALEEDELFYKLNRPRAAMMELGVYPDPENNRLLLLQGITYTQDGGWAQVRMLKEPLMRNLSALIQLQFFPGDYGGSPDMDDYFLCLKGKINGSNIDFRQAAGKLTSPDQLNALLMAARLFAEFEDIDQYSFRYTLKDEEEALKIKELFVKLTGIKDDIETKGKEIIVKGYNSYNIGLVLAYYRYGKEVLL